jgi:hypothetical protein
MGLQGAVLEHFYLRDDNATTWNHGRGPKITAFTQEAGDVVRFTINRHGGLPTPLPNVATLYRPADGVPLGFGVCPDNNLLAESVEIIGSEWTGDDLRLFLRSSVTAPLPVYPYGTMNQAPISNSRIVRVFDRVLGDYLPLQTLAHTHSAGTWAPDYSV